MVVPLICDVVFQRQTNAVRFRVSPDLKFVLLAGGKSRVSPFAANCTDIYLDITLVD